jgi:sulfonate transport system substrate-binding protein
MKSAFVRRIVPMALAALLGAGGVSTAVQAQTALPPLLDAVPEGTVLRVGDPATQKALEFSGLIDQFTFKVEWANISGGPQSTEAFRAQALDVSAVAEIPAIHATWTDLPVRIIASKFRKDPIANPIYEFGVAPGVEVESLADFRGKKIAYSPGQAQGVLVLRALQAAGLNRDDVELIELPSTGDVYPVSLASRQIDVAPIGGVNIKRYLAQYGSDGATTITHGLRDDPGHLYAPQWVLDDPAKAAALAEYVRLWALAQKWIYDNPEEWVAKYYVADQGLSAEDGQYLVDLAGEYDIPANWDDVITRHQATIELLAAATGNAVFDAEQNFDRRFEHIAAEALLAP